MPKRSDINSILVIGAGPIVIGQACEFDYSGTQACKVLKQEGCRVILVNSNPATIMTDPCIADVTYVEPVTWQTVEKIILKEKPDAVLPTMGGQTALNCALELGKRGILEQNNVALIGASLKAIDCAEQRAHFELAMREIGLETPKSAIAHSLDEALAIAEKFGFPCIIRPSFTMGGSGGGVAYNRYEFESICKRGLSLSPTNELLIDESLIGWKEFEMEVVRDTQDNCIIVCSIENLNPMGVHTGDSITVAPALTLTDKEYQKMRNASIAILRRVGVETGGANVQFGICPETGRMVVIEMNPRVSRSSALASKATGFPIAKIATQLALGYTLDELKNDITQGVIPASFEPSIDYIVTKIPRFDFEKFPGVDTVLTTQMKSVGEVMAIGRTFAESLQKAILGSETGFDGLVSIYNEESTESLKERLSKPTQYLIFYIGDALRLGWSIHEIYDLTKVDLWFLEQIAYIVRCEQELINKQLEQIDKPYLLRLKRLGFSDSRLAFLLNTTENMVRGYRQQLKVLPVFKRVDTCSAEFDSNTAYMYSTYEQFCEARATNKKKIIVLGGGPNRIGQGIEFDYCCVHAIQAIKDSGYEAVMINCNPETVSTDYDISDKLYFEPVTLEHVLSIVETEKPVGVIVQYGGQTPLKLAQSLYEAKVPILGTSPKSIDDAEDRAQFKNLIQKLNLLQPANETAISVDDAVEQAKKIGYPLVVRPSYVLGGRAMEIIYEETLLKKYMQEAVEVSHSSPVLLDCFLDHAIEIDVDAISDGEQVVIGGIMQHIEQAGIHSGDSACVLPPISIDSQLQQLIIEQTKALAKELNVIGLMNIQFAIQDQKLYVLEVNPRASRTIPFVSKSIGVSLAYLGAMVMCGHKLNELGFTKSVNFKYVCVKESVMPFKKFIGVDPMLGPEMKSTGEVMGVGDSFPEAYRKAQLGAGLTFPKSGSVILSVKNSDKPYIIEVARLLLSAGFVLLATCGTARTLRESGIAVKEVNKVREGRPHLLDYMINEPVVYVVNTTDSRQGFSDSYSIRKAVVEHDILYSTTIAGAKAIAQAILYDTDLQVRSLQSLSNHE